ncbi:MAG: RluA family pseudouridine synthase [Myxococcota bacterium]|nr:RluA family pseudouridine synthase [Myxococcota bacterium]
MADEAAHTFAVLTGGARLDRWLSDRVELSRSSIQRMILNHDVLVNHRPSTASTKLKTGDVIWMATPQLPLTGIVPEKMTLDIRYMDEEVLIVNKPAGLVVHPGKGHSNGTLVNGLVHWIQNDVGDPLRPGLVHRIDKGTSGLLVVARTPNALTVLQDQFATHTVYRIYLALVWGRPTKQKGMVNHAIGRHPVDRIRFACVDNGGKKAVTHFWCLDSAVHPQSGEGGRISLIACRLETGRTHQIRVHMHSLGHPLLGDPMYGRKKNIPSAWKRTLANLDHQLLHAWRLGFQHPDGAMHHHSVDPPADFKTICETVGIDWQCAGELDFNP